MKDNRQFLPQSLRWLIVIGFVIVWYTLIQIASQAIFHVSVEYSAIPRDLAAHLLLAAICYSLSGRLTRALPAIASLIAVFNLCNAGKIQFYGTPAMPDDFLALRNLFLLLTGWQLGAVVVIVFLPIILILFMVSWRRPRTWFLLGLYTLGAVLAINQADLVVQGMDKVFKNSVWNQRGNFESRGIFIHIVQEGLRYQARIARPPSAPEVTEALAVLRAVKPNQDAVSQPQEAKIPPRNVHMIILESFWDAALLVGSGLSEDPIDPEFRKLWQAAGNSQVLSPVFGGFTANPEFEVLCGLPVTENQVFFEAGLQNSAACLPQVLHEAGYRSIASHPNVAGFWNRVNAYRRIGFDTYWSDRDFVLDDMNGEFLSDASLYRQVMEKVRPLVAGGTPVFNYILTYFGHVDYPLNDKRPRKITTTDENALLNAYVNLMYYKSRELMAFLDTLRKEDPDSLIVLFGDHLPFLGPGFYGFLRSNLLSGKREMMPEAMVHTLTAAPLVVIDGQRGPLALGDVPMYRLPALILDLLGMAGGKTVRLSVTPAGAVIRPLPGMYWLSEKGRQKVCREEKGGNDDCLVTDQWLKAITTITTDLFSGEQYSLPEIEGLGKEGPAVRKGKLRCIL